VIIRRQAATIGLANSLLADGVSRREFSMATQRFEWRGDFHNQELNALHAEAFAHPTLEIDWVGQVEAHSLGWVCARDGEELIGFVNVAWDGGIHAFILDTIVRVERARRGIGSGLVAVAAAEARAVGCQWLHVDFVEELRPFYLDACGFELTPAGLMAL
jgi:GNAT superfamily N-acetyltransferase